MKTSKDSMESYSTDSQRGEIIALTEDVDKSMKNVKISQKLELSAKGPNSSVSASSDHRKKEAASLTPTENVLRERQNLQNEIRDLHAGKKSELSKVLNEIKGDIVSKQEEEIIKSAGESPAISSVPKSQTHLVDSYYVQQRNKFIKTTNLYGDQNPNKSDSNLWLNLKRLDFRSPLDVAILFQRRVICPFFTACHGLLAGVAVMQIVLAYYLTDGHQGNQNRPEDFFQAYQRLAMVGPTCFAFLISICFMSILDRVDLFHIAKCDPQDWISYRRSWAIGLIYFSGLVINAICFRYDHMIQHYPWKDLMSADVTASPDYFSGWHQDHRILSFVPTWQILNAVRCVCAILGWILLCFAQPGDLLADHLQEVKTFDLEIEAVSTIENRPV